MKGPITLDWGSLGPLRLRARTVADGVYAGTHRSPRRGSGVEFGGHRSYVPGDELRWLDRRALMRHGRLMVREFETETDRAVQLLLDATPSMAFRSKGAPGAKLAYSALVAAALARISLASGDPVALDWIGGDHARGVSGVGGREAFERLLGAIEEVEPGGELDETLDEIDRAIGPVSRRSPRGSIVVFLSDLIDLPAGAADRIASLSNRGRTVLVVRVLDPVEATFPFEGPVRLRATEVRTVIETDAPAVRTGYLAALARIADDWSEKLVERGGRLLRAVTSDDPVSTVRDVVQAAEGRAT